VLDHFLLAISLMPLPTTIGRAYFMQGNNKQGCQDVQKAYELGNFKTLEAANGK